LSSRQPHGFTDVEAADYQSLNPAHCLNSPTFQPMISGVQNELILPTLLTGHWKFNASFDSGGEGIHLTCVSVMIENTFCFHHNAPTPLFQRHGTLDIQDVIPAEVSVFTDQFKRRAVLR